MNDKPLISIGLITRNRSEFLPRTLDMWLAQDESRFELIISDNASTDRTAAICEEYAKKDSRIRYFRQSEDIGGPRNYDFVLQQAVGRCFMWAGDDDLWDKESLSELVGLLTTHRDSVLAMSNFDCFQGDRRFERPKRKFDNNSSHFRSILRFMISGDIICLWGLYSTEALRAAGGFHIDSRPYFKNSDYMTIFKVLLRGRAVFTDKFLFHKRDSGLCHIRYEVLRDLHFNRDVLGKVGRYFSLPIFFFYDLMLSLRFSAVSALKLHQKLAVMACAFMAWLLSSLRFLRDLLFGVGWLIVGVLRRLVGMHNAR